MKNSKFKKIEAFKNSQEILRIKAIKSGVNLIAPETIFLSKDTKFGKNVKVSAGKLVFKYNSCAELEDLVVKLMS